MNSWHKTVSSDIYTSNNSNYRANNKYVTTLCFPFFLGQRTGYTGMVKLTMGRASSKKTSYNGRFF